jgi:type 1 glutamine amidotransferase
MITRFLLLALAACAFQIHAADQPVKALLVTGGCCHNYTFQAKALTEGISKFIEVNWTIANEGGNGTRAEIALYDDPNWAENYDIVVHNECFADTTSEDYIRRITRAHHAGVPALVIHCAMHTYRAAEFDDWRKFLGVTSRRHDHQSRYPVKIVAPEHPVMKGFKTDWVTPRDELYIVEKLWPTATALATSASERDGKEHPVVWVNNYGQARVFGTTYGHTDDAFSDPIFIDLLTRGFKWALDK